MPRPTISCRSASKESFKFFKKKYPESKLKFTKWKEIIYAFNEAIIVHALETGEKVKLPWGLGPLVVMKRKQTTFYEKDDKKIVCLPVDWPKSKELGYKVFLLNGHTDGYRYKWYWYPNEARFFKAHIWNFKPCRKVSRLLAKYIKEEGAEYKHMYSLYIRKR